MPTVTWRGDTDGFRLEVAKRSPWPGVVGMHIHYTMWGRHPEYTALNNVIYRLVNPWQKSVHSKLHGVYLDSRGRTQWQSWTMPGITMIHDDSGRTAAYDTDYFNEIDRAESGVLQQFNRRQPRPVMQRIRMRANRVLRPKWYPDPLLPPRLDERKRE